MKKIRVLIVDDSTVIRRLLTDSLSGDAMIEVVGVAANGKIALAKLPQLKPDIVTLDIEMPEMDGLATLTELRKLYPKLPVIMFSTLTAQGAQATLEALSRGASDYVTKPANVGSVSAAIQNVQSDLIPKIKSLTCKNWSIDVRHPAGNALTNTREAVAAPIARPQRVDVVVMGTSTGGPTALQAVLPKLPASFPVPILVVQHMPPVFTKHLAERLNGLCNLNVREAVEGDTLSPGTVWIAPGDYHMGIRRHGTQYKIALNQGPQENSCRPAVDVLFRSAASMYGRNVLSVVMTGMGQDGQIGSSVVRDAGGRVIAQDEATSVVWGMPGSVVRAKLAHHIVPLEKIAVEMTTHVQFERLSRPRQMVRI